MKSKGCFITAVLALCLFYNGLASAQVIDRIVAKVNSDIITLFELNKEAAPFLKQLESAGYGAEKKKEMLQQIQAKVLNLLVDRSLTQQEAARYNITVSDEELDTVIENLKAKNSWTQEELETMLAREGMTLESYREGYKKQMLQTRLINHAVKSKVIITESEIQAFYQENADRFAGTKKYHLRNILMKDKNSIDQVYKQLESKTAFTDLAKKFSLAPNAVDGGDLGFFDISSFSPEIKDSIAQLNIGDYTEVIQTAQGYQIFYVDEILVKDNKTLDQVRDEIHETLYRKAVEKKFETWLDSLKKQAHIEIKL